MTLDDRLAAKLNVLIEGIADHKMPEYNQEMLAKEVISDIRAMVVELLLEEFDITPKEKP